MSQKSEALLKRTFIPTFLIFAFLCLNFVVQPEIYYFAQQPAFQASKYFFFGYLSIPGGLTEYASLFLSQSFYYNWSGAVLLTFTLLTFLFFGYKIFRNFPESGDAFIWMLLPVALLLSLLVNYSFPFLPVLSVLLVYGAVFVSIKLLKAGFSNWYFFIVIAPFVYYIGGSGCFSLYSASFLILILHRASLKKIILPVSAVISLTALLPYLVYKYISNIPWSNVYFDYYLSDNLLLRTYEKNISFYAFFFSVPAMLILISIVSKINTSRKSGSGPNLQKRKNINASWLNKLFLWFGKYSFIWILIIITGLTVILIRVNTFKHQNKIVQADFYCANEEWDKVLSTLASDSEYDIMYNYYYNRAIDNSNQYLDKYFGYPQLFGASGTFPDELNYEMLYFYYSDYYFDLGYISESQQWAYRVLSGLPYSPRILKRLVITNLILGEYKSAGKFLSILSDNLFSEEFVDTYTPLVKDTTLVAANKLIMSKRSFSPSNLITPFTVSERFKNLLDTNKDNKRAYEHMQMNYLLNHQYGAFYNYLQLAPEYYKTLPRVFEEALLIVRTTNERDTLKYIISQPTMNSFIGFSDIYSKYRQNNALAKSFLEPYKSTLFYYIMFDSPLVTKNAPVKMSESEYNH